MKSMQSLLTNLRTVAFPLLLLVRIVAGTSMWLKAFGDQLDYERSSDLFGNGEMRAIGSSFG